MLKRGAISVTLMISLCSCAAPVTITRTEYLKPPTALMNRYPVTEYQGQTNLDLVRYVLQIQTDLQSCDSDMSGLLEWSTTPR